jgi:hypothetical protein
MAEISDEELVEVTLVRPSRLLEVARGAILAAGALEFDGAPGRWRQAADLGENARCAPAQGDKGDPADIETIEAVIGGELGVEDEVARPKDLLGFLALADVGV